MIHYAISDVRFISHGITLHRMPKMNDVFQVLEINSNTLYIYSICGYFPTHFGYQTELMPLFSNVSIPYCQLFKKPLKTK